MDVTKKKKALKSLDNTTMSSSNARGTLVKETIKRNARKAYGSNRRVTESQSTSSVRAPSINLVNTIDVSSSTWTVIRLSEATLLYSSTFWRVGVNNNAPNGCFSRAMRRRAWARFSVGDENETNGGGSAWPANAPNGRPSREMRRDVRVRLTAAMLEGSAGDDGQSGVQKD